VQSTPAALDPPALPPVSKDDVRFWRFLRSFSVTLTFDLWPFELKIGIPLTRAMQNVYTNFDFSEEER